MLTCLYDAIGYALLGSMCLFPCYMVRSLSSHAYMLGSMFYHVYVLGIHMPICIFPCLNMQIGAFTCLDPCSLHVLCHHLCDCALHAMFVCLDLGYVCHAMCYCSPFVVLSFFSCVLAYWFVLNLDPMVFVIVHTPWPISKGLDHPIFMSMLAMLVCATRWFFCIFTCLLLCPCISLACQCVVHTSTQ